MEGKALFICNFPKSNIAQNQSFVQIGVGIKI